MKKLIGSMVVASSLLLCGSAFADESLQDVSVSDYSNSMINGLTTLKNQSSTIANEMGNDDSLKIKTLIILRAMNVVDGLVVKDIHMNVPDQMKQVNLNYLMSLEYAKLGMQETLTFLLTNNEKFSQLAIGSLNNSVDLINQLPNQVQVALNQ